MSESTNDAVQNHRLDAIERRLDKHDEIFSKAVVQTLVAPSTRFHLAEP